MYGAVVAFYEQIPENDVTDDMRSALGVGPEVCVCVCMYVCVCVRACTCVEGGCIGLVVRVSFGGAGGHLTPLASILPPLGIYIHVQRV